MLEEILEELKRSNTTLVAVSKTKPVSTILEYYQRGHKIYGENRVQELQQKQPQLPADIEWHFIGHLQSNKVKYLAPFVKVIHSVDSLKLLREIDKQAARYQRKIECLLQFHIAEESSKFGLDLEEAKDILESEERKSFHNINITGVMGMATYTYDESQIRREFQQLRSFFEFLKKQYFTESENFKEISMGMSGDYKIAIEEGSTMVRIGSLIFGERGG